MHVAAREPNADYNKLDRKLTECKDMNSEVFDWAYAHASQKAKSLYDSLGEKLVQQTDKEQPKDKKVQSIPMQKAHGKENKKHRSLVAVSANDISDSDNDFLLTPSS